MTCEITLIKKLTTAKALCECIRCHKHYECHLYDARRSKIGNQCKECKSKLQTLVDPTKEDLLGMFTYDPVTGHLAYNWNTVHKLAGDSATYMHSEGYFSVLIGKKEYLAHRLIWRMMTGVWPFQVDHKNHIRTDNRWDNLREVSNSRLNQLNTSISRNNSSGVNGVRILPSGRFCAFIMVNRKQISLGTYDVLEDAAAARKAADISYGFHANHGT